MLKLERICGHTAGEKSVYTMRLKDENEGGDGTGGGLKRSHSSPNIAKMMQDEAEERTAVVQPRVDRGNKPRPKWALPL